MLHRAFSIEVSVGVVTDPMTSAQTMHQLLERADRAMYEQKRKRRAQRGA